MWLREGSEDNGAADDSSGSGKRERRAGLNVPGPGKPSLGLLQLFIRVA